MYLSGIGDQNSSLAIPIVGSDAMTVGLSPTTMHVDPVSGLPESQAVAPGTTVVVAPAPASSGFPWMLLVVAGVAWYGYEQGWFKGLLDQFNTKEGKVTQWEA